MRMAGDESVPKPDKLKGLYRHLLEALAILDQKAKRLLLLKLFYKAAGRAAPMTTKRADSGCVADECIVGRTAFERNGRDK